MTKPLETTRKVQKLLGLLFCFTAFLFLLHGVTGCSADQHMVASGGRTIDPGLLGAADPQGTPGPEAAKVTVAATGEPRTVVAGEQDHALAPATQGPVGPAGAQRPAGVIDSWTWYRDFKFDSNQTNLRVPDADKVFEIAIYMKANPTLKVGFDGSMDPLNQDLSDQRVATVRDALIEAGVPGSRIQAGAFTDGKSVHDGRVAVLIRTID
jgi:outer membrane protein OmpA-like peptidoglycan-associated protein